MASEIFKNLLQEYEQKKLNAELNAERKKEKIYSKLPRLNEIDSELNSFAINKAKSILQNTSVSLDDLKKKTSTLKKEKIALLEKNNLSLDDLKPKYECMDCKDTGYVHYNNLKTAMCNCLKQRLLNDAFNQSNLSNLQKDNFDNFNEKMYSDEVDLSKYKYNVSPRKNILNIKKKSEEFVENFDNLECRNLLFTGQTGLGKTFMSNCIAAELLKKKKTVIYQTTPILLEKIIRYKMSKEKNLADNFYDSILNCDLLIIDDLGTESVNSMTLSELLTIINARSMNFDKTTRTIISSNLGLKEIFATYGERIGSRIAGDYDPYYFFGEDIRLKKRKV